MSNNKDKILTDIINAGGQNVHNFPVIPPGKIWVIKEFGAADINLGDNISTIYVLRWDGQAVPGFAFSLTGTTYSNQSPIEFEGDGTKKLSIYRKNYSGHNFIVSEG